MAQHEELPPFVRFALLPQEDRSELLSNGKYGFRNVEVAYITRPGQRDTVVKDAQLWLSELQKRSADGLVPSGWYDHFSKAYDAWKLGLELPPNGTPLRGWTVLLPAQTENLLLLGIRTVEELAALDETGVQRVGMGGARFRDLARDWLASSAQGKTAAEMETLRVANQALTEQVETLLREVQAMKVANTRP